MTDPNLPPQEPVPAEVEADPKRPWKAVWAFFAPLVVLVVGFTLDGSDGGNTITHSEWGTLITAVVLTTGGVFGIRNPVVATLKR